MRIKKEAVRNLSDSLFADRFGGRAELLLLLLHGGFQGGQTGDVAQRGLLDRSVDLLHGRLRSVGRCALLGLLGCVFGLLGLLEQTGVRERDAFGGFREFEHFERQLLAGLGGRTVLLDEVARRGRKRIRERDLRIYKDF